MKRMIAILLALLLPLCASAETIAQKINAPQHYQASYYSNTGKTEILVDAVVHIPDADRVNTYEVAGRDFVPQDVQLLAISAAPELDWQAAWIRRTPSNSHQWSGERDEFSFDPPDYRGYLSYDVTYDWKDETGNSAYLSAANSFMETVFGLRRTDTVAYFSYSFSVADGDYSPSSHYMYDMASKPRDPESRLDGQSLTYGEALAMANTFVQQIALDFTPALTGSVFSEHTDRRAYAFRFTRVIDGIPVTYTQGNGNGDAPEDQAYTSPPQMEEIICIIDQGRIVIAKWLNPWSVGEVRQEDVPLIPFDQIMNIFGTIAPLTIQNMENEYKAMGGSGNRWEIKEIRFGYMPVLRKDNSGLWELRPVWDFIGIRSFAKEYYDWPGNCALTIDAIDGTVIDRGYGY